jgi:hypothetical protein
MVFEGSYIRDLALIQVNKACREIRLAGAAFVTAECDTQDGTDCTSQSTQLALP